MVMKRAVPGRPFSLSLSPKSALLYLAICASTACDLWEATSSLVCILQLVPLAVVLAFGLLPGVDIWDLLTSLLDSLYGREEDEFAPCCRVQAKVKKSDEL